MNIKFTLVADGSFDAALVPILTKILRSDSRVEDIESHFLAPKNLFPAREGLRSRVLKALEIYPSDIVFIHRDAEKVSYDVRKKEIEEQIKDSKIRCYVPVVPVRMTEAWLLFNEGAIRKAAGNPNGTEFLNLPKIGQIEKISDPKKCLHDALTNACGCRGRALKKFRVDVAATRVSELITDHTPLYNLNAFNRLRTDIKAAVSALISS